MGELETKVRINARRPRILIVDDDERLRVMMSRMISLFAEVESTVSGCATLEYLDIGRRIDLIVCDLNLSDMDGFALYQLIRERRPRFAERFVLCTGGATNSRHLRLLREWELPILHKPFSWRELRQTVLAQLECIAESETPLRAVSPPPYRGRIRKTTGSLKAP